MLPRELIEELISRNRTTGFHVLVTLATCLHGLLIVLALRLQTLGQGLVEGVSSALAAPTCDLLELGQSVRI
jgi:hypothetical protein